MLDNERRAHRTLIVSNRLPFTVAEKHGKLKFTPSGGGLVSGMASYLEAARATDPTAQYLWIGWPGGEVHSEKSQDELKRRAQAEFDSYPVFLTEEEMNNFYHGFSNETLWPLFHYFPSYAVYDEEYWLEYKKVNAYFADALMEIYRPGDTIWVNDYQLLLLPRLIRDRVGHDASIGFFLHIPFPSFEIFRLLPSAWRAEILDGMLGADLLGFHTHDYTQYFLRSVLRLLGHEHNMGLLRLDHRTVKAATYPMGIDYEAFHNALLDPEVQKEETHLRKSLRDVKAVLSIDRLDYSKGIVNRLEGFELFLDNNPEWRGKVALALMVTPSRTEVKKYEETKRIVDELVGRINGKFGGIGWHPVLYQFRALPFHALTALYGVSEVALVTPLRDGMNLVAKEYIATRRDGTGVLILSEMAGAAKELDEAIIINPNSREAIAEALAEALSMPQEEQMARNEAMQDRLRRYTVARWAADFLSDLGEVKEEQKRLDARLLTPSGREKLIAQYREARKRLILLDYDGTLIPFAPKPEMAVPGKDLLDLLTALAADARNDVVLISGRDRQALEKWFGGLPVGLVAEHGVWLKEKGGEWGLLKPMGDYWKSSIRPLLETYVDRVPGSFIEEKDYSLVWHYRQADPEQGAARAAELFSQLVYYTANIDVQVLQGSKVLEVKNAGVNKGVAALHWIENGDYDFVLALGDDWTDEDLFSALPDLANTIKVGLTQSYARANLLDHTQVLSLLRELSQRERVGSRG